MTDEDVFLKLSKQEITDFLVDRYQDSPEAAEIKKLQDEGRTVVELPSDFEPRHLKGYDLHVQELEQAIQGFDYIVLYHGTSTVFSEEIQQNGLQPPIVTGENNFKNENQSKQGSVYLGQLNFFGNIFDSVKQHAYQVAKKRGGDPLIVRSFVRIEDCLPDEDVNRAENGVQSIVLGGTTRIPQGIKNPLFLYPQPGARESPYATTINQFQFRDIAPR